MTILSLSAFQNFSADYHYQKYITAKLKSGNAQLLGYIMKSLSIDEANPEYLYEFGNSILDAPLKKDIGNNIDSTLIESKDDQKVLNSLQRKNFKFLRKYKNIKNPMVISIAAYKESIRNNPLNAETYFKLGLTLADLKQTDNIDLLFSMAKKRDPLNRYINYYIGNYYLWNQNLENALDSFRKIFAISNSSGRFLKSYFLYIVNEVYLINPEYTTLAKINPSSYRAYLLLADFLKSKNNWSDSKKAYNKAIKLAPLNQKGDLIYRFASISVSNEDWEEVKNINKRFNHYISSDKDTYKLFNRAFLKCLFDQKEYVEVIKKAEMVLDIDPYNYHSYYYKGLSLFRLGRKGEGISQLEKAAMLSPENIDLLRMLAFLYESTKLYDKALAKWNLIIQLTRSNAKKEKQYSEAFNNILRIKTKLNMAS